MAQVVKIRIVAIIPDVVLEQGKLPLAGALQGPVDGLLGVLERLHAILCRAPFRKAGYGSPGSSVVVPDNQLGVSVVVRHVEAGEPGVDAISMISKGASGVGGIRALQRLHGDHGGLYLDILIVSAG